MSDNKGVSERERERERERDSLSQDSLAKVICWLAPAIDGDDKKFVVLVDANKQDTASSCDCA